MRLVAPERVTAALAVVATVMLAAGCQPYRVEYHKRPAYYQRLVEGPLPDRVTLDDGTVIVYHAEPKGMVNLGASEEVEGEETDDPRQFRIREERESGEVILRAIMPEHVVANTLHCLRIEEYEVLWEQLVAERTKRDYEANGKGVEEFAAFCREHRIELAKMLNRMRIGFATHEVVVERKGNNIIECRFWPQVAVLFRFKRVAMEREGVFMKLVLIY
ncbi:MAG: hypothetical protein GY715_08825 [Planctomycetes bacterium]|nr:hypothetical protein [Planctomycetota bacterium]